MEKYTHELSEITTAFKQLSDQVSQLGGRIAKISDKFAGPNEYLNELEKRVHDIDSSKTTAVTSSLPHIIPFPATCQAATHHSGGANPSSNWIFSVPFLASPGKSLTAAIHDFRPVLQRDGLILLGWDKRKTESGDRFTAYWVTSVGTPRFYSSKLLSEIDFSSARPNQKSYAAEDGIEFYGQAAPFYIVHVAPELMKSNPRHRELREVHISLLKQHGSKVNFDYKYLLKNEKKRSFVGIQKQNRSTHPAGA